MGSATVAVTDEVEEWKEGNTFAWGAAKLAWLDGANGSMLVVVTDCIFSFRYLCIVSIDS